MRAGQAAYANVDTRGRGALMKLKALGVLIVVGLLMSLVACTRVDQPTITKLTQFDKEAALAIQRRTFQPLYEFIIGYYYTKGGSQDTRFSTREKIVEYVSQTMPAHEADTIVSSFVYMEDDSMIVKYDVFVPTIFHEGIVVSDAYIERVSYKRVMDFSYDCLVIEEICADVELNADLGFHRKTYYRQEPNGEWKSPLPQVFKHTQA